MKRAPLLIGAALLALAVWRYVRWAYRPDEQV
jgi:hypothetical protein